MSLFQSEKAPHFTEHEIRVAGIMLATVLEAVANINRAQELEAQRRKDVGSTATENIIEMPTTVHYAHVPETPQAPVLQTPSVEVISNVPEVMTMEQEQQTARRLVEEAFSGVSINFPSELLSFEESSRA